MSGELHTAALLPLHVTVGYSWSYMRSQQPMTGSATRQNRALHSAVAFKWAVKCLAHMTCHGRIPKGALAVHVRFHWRAACGGSRRCAGHDSAGVPNRDAAPCPSERGVMARVRMTSRLALFDRSTHQSGDGLKSMYPELPSWGRQLFGSQGLNQRRATLRVAL